MELRRRSAGRATSGLRPLAAAARLPGRGRDAGAGPVPDRRPGRDRPAGGDGRPDDLGGGPRRRPTQRARGPPRDAPSRWARAWWPPSSAPSWSPSRGRTRPHPSPSSPSRPAWRCLGRWPAAAAPGSCLGILLGLAYLSRQEAIWLGVAYLVLLLGAAASGSRWSGAWRGLRWPVVGGAVLAVPWIVRNALTFDGGGTLGQALENAVIHPKRAGLRLRRPADPGRLPRRRPRWPS